MAKLVKQKYTTASGERKTYAYIVSVPKVIANESNISENDELVVYAMDDKIVIEKKHSGEINGD